MKRKRILWTILAIAVAALVTLADPSRPGERPQGAIAQARQELPATPRHYDELTFPSLPEAELPAFERYQLPNGLTVFLIEDRELPLVSGSLLVRTGSRWEPAEKTGLASLTGSVLRSGGTATQAPAALNEFLENRAASIEASIGRTAGTVSFSALREDLDAVLPLFADVVRQPGFAPQQFELAKNQIRGGIARRNDDPSDVSNREFRKLIYGDTSPYARTVEYATVDNISREDALAFYKTYFHPDRAILGLVGDFDPTEMRQKIAAAFGDWQATGGDRAALPTLPAAQQINVGGLFQIEMPQLTQSYVQIGHLGGRFDSPDYPALSVLNEVLNGFGGRLFNKVRSELGLAYSVYGFWGARFDYDGTFLAGGQTRSETTVPFLDAVRVEIDRLRAEPVNPQELANAKEAILNSFVFNFQDPSQTLSRLMRYEYYGYPADFIFRYQRGVKATTIADIQRVAQEYLQPEKLVTLVVGNSNQIQPPLSALGDRVTTVDIAIPEPTAIAN